MSRTAGCPTFVILLLLLVVVACRAKLLVQTTSGPVVGFLLPEHSSVPSSSLGYVDAWRGIPYGRPPLGALRWAAPQPARAWTEPLAAVSFGPQCMQPDGSGSEDCLYLNVYRTHGGGNGSAAMPVLFYIHGGGLNGGSGADNDFSRFVAGAAESGGVVVVQINYRLNLFGFLAVEQLAAEQGGVCGNYGIQDQLLALQWTQANIGAFGGDPARVTIAGQSSGGTSVFALLSAPRARGLFSGAISLSGSPNVTMSLADGMRQNAPIVVKSGCLRPTSNATVACLRALPAADIVPALFPPAWNMPGIWGLPSDPTGMHYQGIVLVDGVTVAQPFSSALRSAVVDVPLMFGNMGQEPDEYPDQNVENQSLDEWRAFVDKSFAAWGPDVGQQIYSLYLDQAQTNPQLAYDSIVADYGLSCASVLLSAQAKPPVGRYQSPIYVFVNDWAPQKPHATSPSYVSRWAYHTCDLNMLTQSWHALGGPGYQPGPQDLAGASFLSSLWYSFLACRQPGSGWLAVDQAPGWPQSWQTFHIYPNASKSEQNYKADVLGYYQQIGLSNETFWWCD